MTLADLKPGQTGRVESFTDEEFSLKLLEMGCLPGELITIERIAPLGDPMAVWVSGYMLSLRREEASTVIVSRI
jgi:ferrous iron transport protein A